MCVFVCALANSGLIALQMKPNYAYKIVMEDFLLFISYMILRRRRR